MGPYERGFLEVAMRRQVSQAGVELHLSWRKGHCKDAAWHREVMRNGVWQMESLEDCVESRSLAFNVYEPGMANSVTSAGR